MTYTLKTYLAVGNDYVENAEIGGLPGIEYTQDGETYRDIRVNFSEWDDANRKAVGTFIKQIKGTNKWGFIECYRKEVSDFSGGVSVAVATFGQPVIDMYELVDNEKVEVDQPWKWQLKPNVMTEAQFFIDTIGTGRLQVPVSIKDFTYMAIRNHNGLI